MLTSKEIRAQFLDFFHSKEHKIVSGSPVVPFDDPTLLFTNAGMNQFKDVFLGTGKREYNRAADTQKCIRVSGKHNDLEEVGHDTYHHTFFEMLGNWSFGDYYKKEAIAWAWELLTKVWKLPKERLWATVYKSDDEAIEIWKTVTDINPAHILKFGEKDNFWEMGETGPCGPCSEIHINLSDDLENASLVNAGKQECIEIWNLVFIQYNRLPDGSLEDLPAKHVDTGMGFERLCAVIQKKSSNYDTDVFTPIINEIEIISGANYQNTGEIVPIRVIADHIRTLSFAIADGALPGNEGRGYVLRRILRRASRYGRKINLNEPFLYRLVDILADEMGSVFPEIAAKKDYVKKIIKAEEESFNRTLDRGIEQFEKIVLELNPESSPVIPGAEVFKLYDTFGFPVDLTRVMALEKELGIDEEGFNKLMEEQKKRAREATKSKFASSVAQINDLSDFETENANGTTFTGYDEFQTPAHITGFKKDSGTGFLILEKSPFYVEAGGQIDDTGKIFIGEKEILIQDVMKIDGNVIHVFDDTDDIPVTNGIEVSAVVDKGRRLDIMRNHSGTHFMHSALRKILGTHVQQAGSYVGPERLRFDFTHFGKVSPEEISDIEALVNGKLRENIELQHHRSIPIEEAKKMGALMFFGDKYGDFVNVVQFGDFSVEFCGGTHVNNSGQIGLFKILSEASISSGIRRIEAVTGSGIESYINSQLAKIKEYDEKFHQLSEEKKKLERELADVKLAAKLKNLDAIVNSPVLVKGVNIFAGKLDAENADELKSLGDGLRSKIKSGAGLLASVIDGKISLVCVVTDDVITGKKLSAGTLVSEIAKQLGGGGGGRPQLATAGAKDIAKLSDALNSFPNLVSSKIE